MSIHKLRSIICVANASLTLSFRHVKKAELTDKMNAKSEELDEKEMLWLELAEVIEEAEAEAQN